MVHLWWYRTQITNNTGYTTCKTNSITAVAVLRSLFFSDDEKVDI